MRRVSSAWLKLIIFSTLLLLSIAAGIPRALAADYTVSCNADPVARTAELIARIADANASASDDTISLAPGCTYTLTAADNTTVEQGDNGLPVILDAATAGSLTINGSSAVIERSSAGGTPPFRLLQVSATGELTLNNLTLRNGSTSFVGGAVLNYGALTLTGSTLSGNSASSGGAIYTDIDGSLARVNNSTLYDNSASTQGGAIFTNAALRVANSTLSGNSALQGAAIYDSSYYGNNIDNTIIANGSGGADCVPQFWTVQHSLSEDGSCGGIDSFVLLTGDPMLGEPEGSPAYFPLLEGSPVINAGDNARIPAGVTTDQAGNPRIISNIVDMGAYEASFTCPGFPYDVPAGDVAALVNAIHCANDTPADDVINLSVGSTYTLTAPASFSNDTSGLPLILGTLTINGSNAVIERSTDESTPRFRLIDVAVGASLTLNDLTLRNGYASTPNSESGGGGIYNRGTLALTNVTLRDNVVAVTYNPIYGIGGGIFNDGGSVTANYALISGNVANTSGGGIYSSNGSVTITNSILMENSGGYGEGGAIHSADSTLIVENTTLDGNTAGSGAGIYALRTTLTVNGSTFKDNEALNRGGAEGGGIDLVGGSATVTDSAFIDNIATTGGVSSGCSCGSGMFITFNGALVLTNSTFSGNGLQMDSGSVTVNNSTIADFSGVRVDGGALTLNNSILSMTFGESCTGDGVTASHSLVQNGGCGVVEGENGNLTGDPRLGNLIGTPAYFFLNGDSPAINAGDNALVPPGVTTDQAGGARIQGGTVDMGAFEYDVTAPIMTINDLELGYEEGTGSNTIFPFVVSLTAPAGDGGVSFDITIADDTTNSDDYLPNTLVGQVIPAGSTSFAFDVTVIGDYDVEEHETFFVNISNVSGALLGDGQGTATIINDDAEPYIYLNPEQIQTGEDGTNATIFVGLGAKPKADVTVEVSSSDTGEGTVAPAALTFTVADWQTQREIVVTGVNDDVFDGDAAYTIIFSPAVSNDDRYNGLDPNDVNATNIDDDKPGVTITPAFGLLTSEAGASADLTVVLDNPPTADVTIGFSSDNPAEGTVDPASLTFTPEKWNTPQIVTVTGVDDDVIDGGVQYMVLTNPVVSDDPNYAGIDPIDVSAANLDNDQPGFSINPIGVLHTTESGGTDSFTVVLNTQPTSDVVVRIDGYLPEFTWTPAELTFTTANWNVPQTITVTGVDDAFDDGDTNSYLQITPTETEDPDYRNTSAWTYVINADDDTRGVTVTPTSGLLTTEAGGTATFNVVLDSQPFFGTTSVSLSSSDTTEGTVDPETLLFSSEAWNVPQTVTITGVDDPDLDGDIAYTIVTASLISDDGGYNGLDPADVSITNADDEVPAVRITADKTALDTDGGVTRPGDVIEYTITVSNTGTNAATGVTLTDSIPAHTGYVAGSTSLNGTAVADVGDAMPFAAGAAVNSSGAPAGQIDAGAQAVVVFRVAVNNPFPDAVAEVSNQAAISGDGFTPVFTTPTVTPIIRGLSISKAFGAPQIEVDASTALVFTLSNPPENPALTGLAFSDPLPGGLVYVEPLDTPQCNGTLALADAHTLDFNGGTLEPGSACTLTVTVKADGSATGSVTNTTSILSADGDISSASGATAVITVGSTAGEPPSSSPNAPTNTPPQTFECGSAGQIAAAITCSGGIGVARLGDQRGNVYFRVIAQNGQFLASPAEIGIQSVLDLGVLQAVDVSGLLPNGVPATLFDTPVHVCLRGSGEVLFLNGATNGSRTVQRLPSTVQGRYTCVDVPNAGTVVLVGVSSGLDQPPTAPPTSTLLGQCQVTTTDAPINLRAEPNTSAAILAKLPYDLTLTATERVPGWFRVIYLDGQGWVSDRFVTTLGDCGA